MAGSILGRGKSLGKGPEAGTSRQGQGRGGLRAARPPHTCFIMECRATVGKLNLRSIMHRIWQVLVGKTHCQPRRPRVSGRCSCPRIPKTSRWPSMAGKKEAGARGMLPADILSADPFPGLNQ